MSLTAYRSKRAFKETPEPAGQARRSNRRRIFVVQKHHATRLHYDFRLAVRTEDHPLEYAKFEGVIPPGQYGAGTVMVWDLGKYELLENRPPEEQLPGGKIGIVLQG
jgi:DNA polymerase ligase (LigD)-like protein